jgi:hypothetical protein
MLAAAGRDVLVLGDYQTEDTFKTRFDDLVTVPVIECLYPDLAASARALGQSKMRSEFFLIGREVFNHFWTTRFPFGTDPTVELILATLGNQDLTIDRVHFGEVADDPDCRHPMGQLEQIFRFVVAPAIARIRQETLREDNLRAYDGARCELERVFELVLAALDENRDTILKETELAAQSAGDASGT